MSINNSTMNSPVEPTDRLNYLEEKMDIMVVDMQGIIFNNRSLKTKGR